MDAALGLSLVDHECLRCATVAPMRFRGLCPQCRDALRERFAGEAREIAVAEYEPKMNVTPNAVALKDD
ncbi:MAG: hypothetical protein ACKOA9_01370 [Actinomycetota bacterium]